MANQVGTRTDRARICTDSQVHDGRDSLGSAARKPWNVGRWTPQRVWVACGRIPSANAHVASLKTHDRYANLHSQSRQRVLQELGEAFDS